jgi:hypothetical protein
MYINEVELNTRRLVRTRLPGTVLYVLRSPPSNKQQTNKQTNKQAKQRNPPCWCVCIFVLQKKDIVYRKNHIL